MAMMEEPEQEIADLIGDEATFQLVENFGGTRIYVPKDASRSRFAELIGQEGSVLLSRHFGGTEVLVPLAKHWRIHAYRERGYTVARIAVRLCVAESTVYAVLSARGMTEPGRHGAAPSRRSSPPRAFAAMRGAGRA